MLTGSPARCTKCHKFTVLAGGDTVVLPGVELGDEMTAGTGATVTRSFQRWQPPWWGLQLDLLHVRLRRSLGVGCSNPSMWRASYSSHRRAGWVDERDARLDPRCLS